jgi:hypothetical protein
VGFCTDIGCVSGASFDSRPLAQPVSGNTLEVCRNQQCYQGTFTIDLAHIAFPDPTQRQTLQTPLIDATFFPDHHLLVGYEPYSEDELHDGDVYDIRYRAADGTILLDSHLTVTYEVVRPNGDRCPPACTQTHALLD